MAIEWSGSTPELLLPLERGGGTSLRAQLLSGLREAIRDGRLHEGERLPSTRELSRQLGVSRGLVQECYGQLLAEGYLVTRGGSATRVAPGSARPAADAAPTAPPPPGSRHVQALIADFRAGVPDLASFPRGDWAWAVRETCRTAANADLDYGDPRGSVVLRQVLAGYLRRVRAAEADPDRIVVSTGFAQGLVVALRALTGADVRRVAFEDPGYGATEVEEIVRAVGAPRLEAVHVPVDEQGVDVEALESSGAQAVVVMPAHQSPTGVVLSARRRNELVAWARRHDGYVVEDDYDSEFRYDREPVGVVQGLAPERVFTIGTVSKTLAPAVRLGWVLAPGRFADRVAEEKLISDRGSSALDQLALAALLESGRYDRHLRRMRAVYAGRRATLVDALARHARHVRVSGLAAGFHAVAHLPASADERAVVAAAAGRSVGLYPMADHRALPGPNAPQLVLGFGLVGERAIETGIATVADLLH
ncbi:GntR family transcriptional regulator/MocR family aminotransferase [Streptacidiphilus sp. MAP12-33]|uniref:MocR-like pyridoxine biosynthesis transcription factor PdxR n=1 Tax=Streptacidiphilus sp. MAP12-33 TaxID=3156266 RepID=UPI0035160848